MTSTPTLPTLLLIVDVPRLGADWLERLADACAGGVAWIQLRDPDAKPRERRRRAEAIATSLPERVLCSVNDDPEIARQRGWGLHLPARRLESARCADAPRPCGASAHDAAELRRAEQAGADYAIVGTLFPTRSKPGRLGIGADGLRRLIDSGRRLPVYAIGGVGPDRVGSLARAGAAGVAVCDAILAAPDVAAAAAELGRAWRLATAHG